MKVSKALRLFRATLAAFLALWVAGAGCILGCESMIATAAASETFGAHTAHTTTMVAEGHACPSRKTPDCCQKSAGEVETKTVEHRQSPATPMLAGLPTSGTMKECPLATSRATAVNKIKKIEPSAAPFTQETFIFQSPSEQKSSLSSPLRLPNRGHTYLRCCVFLI